jgi:hypothetical protein
MPNQLYALLAGINDYPADPQFKLHGCIRDIDLFAAYLQDQVRKEKEEGFKFHLRVLKDHEATRQNLIAGFQEHLAQAGDKDIALFYFSGHGSQQGTADEFRYLEPDGKDETLVCWDSRQPGSWDLADKELAFLLARVAAKDRASSSFWIPVIRIGNAPCRRVPCIASAGMRKTPGRES